MMPPTNLTAARRYIDRQMALESKDPALLKQIALCYLDFSERLLAIIAMPTRQTVNWREEIPE